MSSPSASRVRRKAERANTSTWPPASLMYYSRVASRPEKIRRLARASPNTAPRAWPTCIGPVGLALTYSTLTGPSALGAPAPKRTPWVRIVRKTWWWTSGLRTMLMKPGPAASALETSGSRARSAARLAANARGFEPASLASRAYTIAALVERSPWTDSRGGSTTKRLRSTPRGNSPAAIRFASSRAMRDWKSAKTFIFLHAVEAWAPQERAPLSQVGSAVKKAAVLGDRESVGHAGDVVGDCPR